MDKLIITKENHIIHIANEGYTVDYTIYNSKGLSLDGGVFENDKEKFNTDEVLKEIVKMFKDTYSLQEPYMYLNDTQSEYLLDLILTEDYKNMKSKLDEYISSVKEDLDVEIEK